jgi:hypothetical protein
MKFNSGKFAIPAEKGAEKTVRLRCGARVNLRRIILSIDKRRFLMPRRCGNPGSMTLIGIFLQQPS